MNITDTRNTLFILLAALSYLSLPHLTCTTLKSPNSTTLQTTGLSKNESLSGGLKLQASTQQQTSGLTKLSDSLKTPDSSTNNQPTNTETQTEAQRTQDLTTNFITPISSINTMYQKALKIDLDLNKNIQARMKKSRYASIKNLQSTAQTKKVAAYIEIFTAIKQLFANPQYLPTNTELKQTSCHDAALNLGSIIQALIQNICEQPKKTNKMNIKSDYQKAIQRTNFLVMIQQAANFSRGFNTQQNNDIKRALTMLAQSSLPTITK